MRLRDELSGLAEQAMKLREHAEANRGTLSDDAYRQAHAQADAMERDAMGILVLQL